MVIFAPPRQDPGSIVLNVEFLEALARDLDEEGISIVQPGGDKGMDQPLSIRL